MSYSHTRGDSWVRTFLFKDSAKKVIDITGATVRAFLRNAAGDVVVSATNENGFFVVTGTEGKITLNVPGDQMELELGVYRYDVEVTFSDGRILTIDKNKIHITEDLTNG